MSKPKERRRIVRGNYCLQPMYVVYQDNCWVEHPDLEPCENYVYDILEIAERVASDCTPPAKVKQVYWILECSEESDELDNFIDECDTVSNFFLESL